MPTIPQDEPDDEAVEDIDLRRLAYLAAACAGAVALLMFIHWRLRRVEATLARRHPLLTEALEELAGPGRRRR